jgi:hypothetical protein
MNMIKVTLNEGEQELVMMMGHLRNQRHQDRGEIGAAYGREGVPREVLVEDGHIQGFGAEMAFAKAYNRYPDFSLKPDDGYDIVMNHKVRVNVKHTRLEYGRLLAPIESQVDDCDSYVLVRGELPTYYIIGWCYSLDLIREERIDYTLPVPGYAMPTHELQPMPQEEEIQRTLDEQDQDPPQR